MNFLRNLIPGFLYSALMTGIIVDGNSAGALRAMKDAEQWKHELNKKINE